MIVDSSALIALLLGERDAPRVAVALSREPTLRMSAATRFETSLVIDRKGAPQARRELDALLRDFDVTIEPFTDQHAAIARLAYREFGKHSGHPAQLNFGDCFSYALAMDLHEPLLFVGKDFSHTDVIPALT